ncbi:hypothetical protein [Chelativorans sp. Marseille-P2723]|uniref:hypothetical protein n=1 Tax=Chelativorans sp. Marseille-P2723 TaxID=2709133 RepID=UPI0015707006|nr:hypothetical protein [Chelativorans sp. Marseille-P2723]
MDWKDKFESTFGCKAILWSLIYPRAMLLINSEGIPPLSEVGAFFTREVPEVSSVRIVTRNNKFVHFFKPSHHEDWRVSKSSDD